jgi:L-idonate 5-dehydrogenase
MQKTGHKLRKMRAMPPQPFKGHTMQAVMIQAVMIQAVMIHGAHDLRIEPFGTQPLDTAAQSLEAHEVQIELAAGGICGSDLHYFHAGGFGTVRVKHPMVLGHEASGHIKAVGAGVTHLKKGDLVAINPSIACNTCQYCQNGQRVHCENMIFNGSAMRNPHVDGLFRDEITVDAARAFLMPSTIAPEVAALCEPLAVVLHAFKQAGDVRDKRVFVSGCGPIGALAIIVARLQGAKDIIASDITQNCLTMAQNCGATLCFNLIETPDALAPYQTGKGHLDVVMECSGNKEAIANAVMTLKPNGTLVFVGLGGDAPLPINAIVAREINLRGSFRFDAEFGEAARLIAAQPHEFAPLISATYKMEEAVAAFHHAGDRTRATKVSLVFNQK